MTRAIAFGFVAALQAGSLETYRSVSIDSQGNLAIVKSDGHSVVIKKKGEQKSFAAPVISSARTAVAAEAMFSNCCTSYDVPLELTVYSRGKAHRFKGDGLAIFQWGFADAGTRIAYGKQTVHFACAILYELRTSTQSGCSSRLTYLNPADRIRLRSRSSCRSGLPH